MIILGVTGSIGMGKTEAGKYFIKNKSNNQLKHIFKHITFRPIFILIIRTFPILPFTLGSNLIASSETNKKLIILNSLFGAYFYYFSLFFIIKNA